MNHFEPNPKLQPAQQTQEVLDTGPSSAEVEQARRDRSNKRGFIIFMGAFFVYLFIQAVFFPSGGTAPT